MINPALTGIQQQRAAALTAARVALSPPFRGRTQIDVTEVLAAAEWILDGLTPATIEGDTKGPVDAPDCHCIWCTEPDTEDAPKEGDRPANSDNSDDDSDKAANNPCDCGGPDCPINNLIADIAGGRFAAAPAPTAERELSSERPCRVCGRQLSDEEKADRDQRGCGPHCATSKK